MTTRNKPRWVGAFAVATVLAIFGFLVGQQVRLQALQAEQTSLMQQRSTELIQTIQTIEKERASLEAELALVKEELARYDIDQEKERLLAAMAGYAPAKGPGLIVKVVPAIGSTVEVVDDDLLRLTNELRAAGAEGLAVNGIRLLANSEIRMVGQRLSVSGKVIGAPYQVEAIGDPEVMERALRMPAGVADHLAAFGLKLEIIQKPELHLPAHGGGLAPLYLEPGPLQ